MMANGGVANKEISVVCGDLDEIMVDLAAERIRENGWPAKAERLDAQVTRDSFTFCSYWGNPRWLTLRSG